MELAFYRQIFEKYTNFLIILLVGAELLQAVDGQTDTTNLIVAVRSFVNATKKTRIERSG